MKHVRIIPSSTSEKVASARLRAYWLAHILKKSGHHVSLGKSQADDFDVLYLQKRYDQHILQMAIDARKTGKKVIFDICDNRFSTSKNLQELENLKTALGCATVVTCSSDELRHQTRDFCEKFHIKQNNFIVLQDYIEDYNRFANKLSFLSHFSALSLLLLAWDSIFQRQRYVLLFGNYSEDVNKTGVGAVEPMLDKIKNLQQQSPTRLMIISNIPRAVRERWLASGAKIIFRPWNYLTFAHYIKKAVGVILPVQKNEFSAAKSSNRLVTAIYFKKPVWFEKIPAYEGFTSDSFDDIFQVSTDHSSVETRLRELSTIQPPEAALNSTWMKIFES